MEITDGCSVSIYSMCVYIDLRACVRVSQIRVSFEQVFLAKMKGMRGDNGKMGEAGAGGGGKRALFLLTFTAGTFCLDASAEKNIWFR